MKLIFFILTLIALGSAYILWPKDFTSTLKTNSQVQSIQEVAIPIPHIIITLMQKTSETIPAETTPQLETNEATSIQTTETSAEEIKTNESSEEAPIESSTQEASNESSKVEATVESSTQDISTQLTVEATTEESAACSSPDSTGLAIAFDRELGIFLNNAAATYGSQYSNLQYSISNQQITQNENQGSVSANYQGSVSEIATGETISASGGMTVTFLWDGCSWVLVDYSYF
jgi:hypothetical protein